MVNIADFEKISAELKELLGLEGSPVAVKVVVSPEDIPEDIPEIDEEMKAICDYSFDTTEKFYNFLFD